MAYVSKEDKARLSVGIKKVLKKYGVKGTISVNHHSTLVVKLKSGDLDIVGNYWEHYDNTPSAEKTAHLEHLKSVGVELDRSRDKSFNEHRIKEDFSGEVAKFFEELVSEMKGDEYFNDDDIMTDYFHRSHYIEVKIGYHTKGGYGDFKNYEFTGATESLEELYEDEEGEEVPPNVPSLYRFASKLVETNLKKGEGRDMVLEMLKHGKECYEKLANRKVA